MKLLTEANMQTKGEQIVRTSFNPSSTSEVAFIKEETAKLINRVEELKDLDPRLAAIAITKYEEAAMFAVKLATT